MEALVIEPRTKSDARFLRNVSKRMRAEVFDNEKLLVDMAMRRLHEERLLSPDVSEDDVMKALYDFAKQRGLSAQTIDVDEFLEEYEDMILGLWIEEGMNEPRESMEDV